ncbi:CPBP family glutamic-type intramembrane protease [Crossiella cryophila]|uniref:Membrane protease YdiL (CAAX protease family) n=1 Tax=Crossiella cryophila TaxID=43355 RepID=A0A7W7CFU7_9PSEU|nr:CPBP family intramembrane glutamic endopeptidase [Crossiella cryophila]MBB4680442.1 membrane protease YdiL (CAAX protease family) [Crossiella cryophila]
MSAALPWLGKFLLAAAFVVLYYRYCKQWLFAGAQRLAQRVNFVSRYDRSEVGGVLELMAAAVSHLAVVVILLGVTGISLAEAGLGSVSPTLIVLGALLGIGEMALASFLCRLLIEASLRWNRRRALSGSRPSGATDSPRSGPATVKSWLAVGRGGWLRHHFATLQVLPLPAAVCVVSLQVGCEEVVFRGILLNTFRPAGPVVAILASTVLFVGMQVFFMSSWRAAMFPVVGALVMGVVHGLLAWQVPELLPLVVAHLVFFLFAVI